MSRFLVALVLSLTVPFSAVNRAVAETKPPNNIILFVPDGLRAKKVTPELAPTMAAIRDRGVNFRNSHALMPTFTMANASAMATGHDLGDTGNFSNTLYVGFPPQSANGSVTPFIENNRILGELDDHFADNYLSEETILKLARIRGFSTAALGKHGPTLLFDHTARSGTHSIVFDDATGTPIGIPLSEEVRAALAAAGLPLVPPSRGENAKAGNFDTPGTTFANVEQQAYFVDVVAKVLLPMFKARNKPFVLVFWSRDPDGSQHNQGDSHLAVVPGINGPTSHAAIRNADTNLERIQNALGELGLAGTTNIIVTADHGFSTISKESSTSPSAKVEYSSVPKGLLPPGFLALDLAKALGLPLFDPAAKNARVAENAYPRGGSGLIGSDPGKPEVVVATNGGSDLIYLPSNDHKLAARVVDALMAQDYVSGIFLRDDLGRMPGTLPMSALNLIGKSRLPTPAIVVNFRSWHAGCDDPEVCAVEVADAGLQQGQGMHGNFSRADTHNFTAAIGPDFKKSFVDEAPVSNADVGRTIAHLLGLTVPDKGKLAGRIMREAFPRGTTPKFVALTRRSEPSAGGLRTVLLYQRVGDNLYFDAAGFPGRTAGIPTESDKAASR